MESQDTETKPTPPPTNAIQPGKNPKRNLFIIGSLTAVALLVIAAFLLLGGNNSPVGRLLRDPQLQVNGNAFVYACNALTKDDLTQTLELKSNGQEVVSQDTPLNTNERDTDLLKLTGEKTIDSSCSYGFNQAQEETAKPTGSAVQVIVTQYETKDSASKGVANLKPKEGTKSLPSFDGKGENYFAMLPPSQDSPQPSAEASLIKDSNEIYIKAMLEGDLDEGAYLKKLDTAMLASVKRIDSGQATKPVSFTGWYELGGKKLVDTCKTIDLNKLSQSMGGVEFNLTNLQDSVASATQTDKNADKKLESACVLDFRTANDKQAQEGKKIEYDEKTDTNGYDRRFTHTLDVETRYFDSPNSAKAAMAKTRDILSKPTFNGYPRPPLQNVAIGDTASKSHQDNDKTGYSGDDYYILQGQFVYRVSLTAVKQQQPFVSEGYTPSDDVVRQIFDQLNNLNK